jgi:dihydroorotate dehydrogenase
MYPVLRSLLFLFDPELAHHLSLFALKAAHRLGLLGLFIKSAPTRPTRLLDLSFSNPIGLAAGLDKNGDYIDALGELGFGFLEVGTITPRPQVGNPKPRLFRLPEHRAIINRMGFNNKGVDYLLDRVRKSSYSGVLGINIGKNFDTPNERAVDDYLVCLRKVYPHADYIVVNISSPNTKGLRDLQHEESLRDLLSQLVACQETLSKSLGKLIPLFVKIAPDLSEQELIAIAKLVSEVGVQGLVATNTTIDKSTVNQSQHGEEAGGLSGAVLSARAREVVSTLRTAVGPDFPIIGVGGVMSGEDAQLMIAAGANLVQVYSGFVYEGPALIHQCLKALESKSHSIVP